MREKRRKRTAWILDGILIAGFLTHCIILFVLNKVLPPPNLPIEDAMVRMSWRRSAENIIWLCNTIYIIGQIALILKMMWDRDFIPFSKLFLFAGIQVLAMFICPILFSLIDPATWGDSFFWSWGILVTFLIFFGLLLISDLYRFYKEKRLCKRT